MDAISPELHRRAASAIALARAIRRELHDGTLKARTVAVQGESVRVRLEATTIRAERPRYPNLIATQQVTISQLQDAMQSRAVIEQAKGIIMSSKRCDADTAFDVLRRASQRRNEKLRKIAQEIVDRASGEHCPPRRPLSPSSASR